MDFVEGPIPLGEWVPDQYDLKFPNLEMAYRVEPIGTVYKSFEPLVDAGGPVVPGTYLRGFGALALGSTTYYYAATDHIYISTAGAAFSSKTGTIGATTVDFLQFDEQMIAAIDGVGVMFHPVISSTATSFQSLGSATGTAPRGKRLGKINKFLIVGNTETGGAMHMQWSGLDAFSSWPTPNSSTAIAQQAGEQFLDADFGEITGFANGDQFGLVFQNSAITRINYAGPPVVFQFDKISDKIGCPYPRSIVQAGGFTYFISASGFHRTDGVSVQDIGLNKTNRYFLGLQTSATAARVRVYGAYNKNRNLIYWSYCSTSDVNYTPDGLIIYNTVENRFSEAPQPHQGIFGTNEPGIVANPNIFGYAGSNTLGAFQSGTASGIAVIETGDVEFNPGGFSHLSGAKLIVDQTANAVVAYSKIRNELMANQLTSSAASTTNAVTGFSDFRREARYHRTRFEVTGVFDQAQSVEFKAKPSGGR